MRYYKHDIARAQLETAVSIILNGQDRSSAITLAGAASSILDAFVRRAGKEAFVDYARRVHEAQVGFTPKRKSYAHHIDKTLGVIAHKHLSQDDPDTVDLDLEKMAVDAVARAIHDYVSLNGQEDPFVKAFLQYAWVHSDGEKVLKEYNAKPDRMKPRT
ncbi:MULTISPECIES: hypothetical protein [unclassified Rhizobacter]|uniref:hypothetical protein n=1 Tax=unclassified Rhizobacter TaxID=2640088 RepID=UPI0006F529A8|nr:MULTISPECIES: hypothetical protein [unclassified Rhizobacter]KQU75620.1 hypothetical protein ASC88_24990 [Rhizobacter sp. Root29]KQW07439.1 hypothetical protein ASC98_25465 [Rhizobacter sp. Root1238]